MPLPCGVHDHGAWEQRIREIYTDAAQGVIDLQEKLGWYREDRISRYQFAWPEIRQILSEPPGVEAMNAYLESVGLDIQEFEQLYGPEKIENAIWYAKDLKDRYSVLWIYGDLLANCTKEKV